MAPTVFVRPLDAKHICPVHNGLMVDPVTDAAKVPSVCRACKKSPEAALVADVSLQAEIDSLLVLCKNGSAEHKGGCTELLRYADLAKHEAECPFNDPSKRDFLLINGEFVDPEPVVTSHIENAASERWSIEVVQIVPEWHWWGFILHLNEDATQLLEKITELAAKLIKIFGSELGPVAKLIGYYLKLRNFIIKLEDKGKGVKVVSPWMMPTLLIPLPDSYDFDDSQLRWNVYSDGAWCPETKMANNWSEAVPALAIYKGKLFCVYRGSGTDSQLSFMSFDGQWSDYQRLPYSFSKFGGFLTVHNDRLWCAYLGDNKDTRLAYIVYDGNSWSNYSIIPEANSDTIPAIMSYNGKLMCVYQGRDDHQLYWTALDSNGNWSRYTAIPNTNTNANPALAIYQGKLYCAYRAGGDGRALYYITFDSATQTWSNYVQIPNANSDSGPSFAVYNGLLYMAYCGAWGDTRVVWMTFDGNKWSNFAETGGKSTFTPSIVTYRQASGTKEQLLCMHRGV